MSLEPRSESLSERFVEQLAPAGSRRRVAAGRLLGWVRRSRREQSDRMPYDRWIRTVERRQFLGDARGAHSPSHGPLISIVVPCFNTPKGYLNHLVQSVRGQHYGRWQLCLADGSSDPSTRRHIRYLARKDDRIDYLPINNNLGIAGNTNVGVGHANGEFVAFLDHDDVLSPFALHEVASYLQRHPETDVIYTDEDKLFHDSSRRQTPLFKPDWSPDLLLGVNYITHLLVVRRRLIEEIGGLRTGLDGAQDYDLLLRLTEKTQNVAHIPRVLYHWRLARGSTSENIEEKSYADIAGRQALIDALTRRGVSAEVVETDMPTHYRLKYHVGRPEPAVSVVLVEGPSPHDLSKRVKTIIELSDYGNYEIVLVSRGNVDLGSDVGLVGSGPSHRCRGFRWSQPFNLSAMYNFARSKASGEYIVFLDSSIEVVPRKWIEELVGVAAQRGVGEVGALIRYPDGRIHHAGVILGMSGIAGFPFRDRKPGDWTHFGMAAWPRNYLAVSGGCVTISADAFDVAGGFDERFASSGGDVALGIALHEAGYRNVYWPFVEMTRRPDPIPGTLDQMSIDADLLRSIAATYLAGNDPYFNANLDLMIQQIGLRTQQPCGSR